MAPPSAWPWMQGIDEPIADPIPPVNERDRRPSVKDLIESNRQGIYEVRRDLLKDPLYNSRKHDDLWILRFLLSHKKKSKEAAEAAKYTLAFRQKHNLDEKDVRLHPWNHFTQDASYMKYLSEDAIVATIPDAKRGVVGFYRYLGFDYNAIMENVQFEEWLGLWITVTEWSFQWTDYLTRTTGRLTKNVRFVDMRGVDMLRLNKEMSKMDTKATGLMEDCYPQLLHVIYMCHTPAWCQVPWRLLRPLLPKRVVNKFDFINPSKSAKEKKRLMKFITEDNLPVRFGGKYEPWPAKFPLPQ